jgi:hypothetical protein
MFSKYWKQGTLLIVVTFVAGTFITKAPGVAAKAEAAFSEVQHLLHDADILTSRSNGDMRRGCRENPFPIATY